MKFGVVVFPGSNCDADTFNALAGLGYSVRYLWHAESRDLSDLDCIVLPGGFSYGDYLRPGAIARFSGIMNSVVTFARRGGLVLGICNGFQILTEAGLLPGALLQNNSLQFRCQWQWLRVESRANAFSCCLETDLLQLPIAHGDGCYYLPEEQLAGLEANGQIVLRYADAEGNISAAANPNGAAANVAAVVNEGGNVLGMMPHPERAVEGLLGGTDGQRFFAALVRGWEAV